MPTIDIPDKICPHCGSTRWHKRKNKKSKDGIRYECIVKINERFLKWHHKKMESPEFREMRRERQKNWENKNKDKVKASQQRYRQSENGRIVVREKDRNAYKKGVDTLSHLYIKKLLKYQYGVKKEDMTDDMMNKYKTYILALRQLKQIQNEKTKQERQKD